MPSPFGSIPMPMNAMDAFMSGMQSSQKMFDSMMSNRTNAARANLAQQAANREEQLLPYRLQEFSDKHNLSPVQRAHLEAQIRNESAQATGREADNKFQQDRDNNLAGGQDNTAPVISPSAAPTDYTASPGAGDRAPTAMPQAAQDQANKDLHPNIGAPANVIAPNPYVSAADNGNNATNVAPISNFVQPAKASVPAPQLPFMPKGSPGNTGGAPTKSPQELANEQEDITNPNYKGSSNSPAARGPIEVVSAGRPSEYKYDRFAGTKQHGIDFPKVVIDKADGFEEKTYPSGLVTRQKIGPSAEEKAATTIDVAEKKAQNTSDIKASAKIEDDTKTIAKSIKNFDSMYKLLEDHPKLTGPAYNIPFSQKLSKSQPLAEFTNKAGLAQGEIAHNTTASRTGVGALNWAKLVKPDATYDPSRNKGFIKANLEELLNGLEENKKLWIEKNPGKKLPSNFEIPDVSRILKSSDGGTPKHYVVGADGKIREKK